MNASLSTVNCHWKKLLKLVSAGVLGAALLAPHSVAAQPATRVPVINGNGSVTFDVGFQIFNAPFAVDATLHNDGSATGSFRLGNPQNPLLIPVDFNTEFTSWSINASGFWRTRVLRTRRKDSRSNVTPSR